MVIYFLIKKTDEELIYEYFPENDRKAKPGYIRIDRVEEKVEISEVAELDQYRLILSDDINQYYEVMNKSLREEGLEQVEWERLPSGKDCGYYPYASKAIKQIVDEYNGGNIQEDGYVIWY